MKEENKIIVSIIIPAYNYGNYIGECLDSVLAQTFPDWECLVIDNGSTDHTAEVVQKYVSKDKRIGYHFTEQKGVSFARNKAVELSKGKYIFPLDADDRIADTYIEKAFRIIEKDKTIKVVYSDAELFGTLTGKWTLPAYSFKNLLIENSIFCTALFRKSDFEKAKGYNEEMKEGFEDWDFWIRMLKDGGNVYKIPEVLFYYRIRANSRNGRLDREKQLNLRRKIVENHQEMYDKLFDLPGLIFDHYTLIKELDAVKNSLDRRIGSFLLQPARFLKRLFSAKK